MVKECHSQDVHISPHFVTGRTEISPGAAAKAAAEAVTYEGPKVITK